MCARHGSQGTTSPAKSVLDRRSLLKADTLGSIVMAVPAGMVGLPGSACVAATVKGNHGNGFCNVTRAVTRIRQYAVLRRSDHLPRHAAG